MSLSLACPPAPRPRRGGVLLPRLCLGLGLGAAGLVALPTGSATAAVACRSDPVIVVNGTAADVVSTLYTDPSVIKELDYVVTVPTGAVLGGTRLTIGLGFPEKVTYVYSTAQPRGTLRVDATVQTQAGTTPFQTTVQVTTLLGGVQQASGLSTSTVSLVVGHQVML